MFKIISGGQTGVDRGALDAALAVNMPCGGCCPEGRLAEDGAIPGRFPLQELGDGDYRHRTLQNVLDSDGTIIIYFRRPVGGTVETLYFCLRQGKPYRLIDAEQLSVDRAAELIQGFIAEFGIQTLNVAGPRASQEPRAYGYAFDVVHNLLVSFIKSEKGS